MKSSRSIVCPYCGNEINRRIRRKKWMRMISSSKFYECKRCWGEYLCLGIFTFRIRMGNPVILYSNQKKFI